MRGLHGCVLAVESPLVLSSPYFYGSINMTSCQYIIILSLDIQSNNIYSITVLSRVGNRSNPTCHSPQKEFDRTRAKRVHMEDSSFTILEEELRALVWAAVRAKRIPEHRLYYKSGIRTLRMPEPWVRLCVCYIFPTSGHDNNTDTWRVDADLYFSPTGRVAMRVGETRFHKKPLVDLLDESDLQEVGITISEGLAAILNTPVGDQARINIPVT